MTDPLWIFGHVWAALFGLIIGSFLNVCIARWPEDRSVIAPRSHCPRCGTTLGPAELVPVVSWLLQGGKCRHCGAEISAQYALIEVLGMLLSLLAWRRFVPGPEALDLQHFTAWLAFFAFLSMLVVATYVDLRHYIIPDEVTIYAVPVGIGLMALLEFVGYRGWGDIGLEQSLYGAAVGGGTMATASLVTLFIMRREGLGWGDVKLMALIGAFIGPVPTFFFVLLVGSMLGALGGLAHMAITRRRSFLPFGPALAVAAGLWVLYGDLILPVLLPGTALRFGLG
ncbi:MAG: prepilin peptidase [Deltaproteobacteria bacterium]|nr:MAG: prepilin peptidase [Deltaproteobacteria bacterium]